MNSPIARAAAAKMPQSKEECDVLIKKEEDHIKQEEAAISKSQGDIDRRTKRIDEIKKYKLNLKTLYGEHLLYIEHTPKTKKSKNWATRSIAFWILNAVIRSDRPKANMPNSKKLWDWPIPKCRDWNIM